MERWSCGGVRASGRVEGWRRAVGLCVCLLVVLVCLILSPVSVSQSCVSLPLCFPHIMSFPRLFPIPSSLEMVPIFRHGFPPRAPIHLFFATCRSALPPRTLQRSTSGRPNLFVSPSECLCQSKSNHIWDCLLPLQPETRRDLTRQLSKFEAVPHEPSRKQTQHEHDPAVRNKTKSNFVSASLCVVLLRADATAGLLTTIQDWTTACFSVTQSAQRCWYMAPRSKDVRGQRRRSNCHPRPLLDTSILNRLIAGKLLQTFSLLLEI